MPTYEYKCRKCRKRHEAFQLITAKPLTTCPACGGRLERLLGSGSGFLFKGSGFYATDYRSKGYTDAKKKDEQASSPKTPSGKPSGSGPPTKDAGGGTGGCGSGACGGDRDACASS